MILPRHLYDELIAHAQEEAPLECCGLIACEGEEATVVYRCTNAAASEVRYEVDGPEQLAVLCEIEAAAGPRLGAIYHSHTHSPAYPSLMDIETAFYPDALYIIVGLEDRDFPEVRAFRIRDGKVEEEALEVR